MYKQVFHFMGFAVGSLVGTPLEAAHTFKYNEDFLETNLALETTSAVMIRLREKHLLGPFTS